MVIYLQRTKLYRVYVKILKQKNSFVATEQPMLQNCNGNGLIMESYLNITYYYLRKRKYIYIYTPLYSCICWLVLCICISLNLLRNNVGPCTEYNRKRKRLLSSGDVQVSSFNDLPKPNFLNFALCI